MGCLSCYFLILESCAGEEGEKGRQGAVIHVLDLVGPIESF